MSDYPGTFSYTTRREGTETYADRYLCALWQLPSAIRPGERVLKLSLFLLVRAIPHRLQLYDPERGY